MKAVRFAAPLAALATLLGADLHAQDAKTQTIDARGLKLQVPASWKKVESASQMRAAQLVPVLELLEVEGVVMRGELRPGGNRIEWCDTEVLRRLKRGTLARLRQATAAVDSRALVRFLPLWHKLVGPRCGIDEFE